MPTFTATLSDGREVEIDADRQPTNEEAQQIVEQHLSQPQEQQPQEPKVGAFKTFLQHAAAGVGPGAAFVAAAPTGAEIGSGIGSFGGPVGTAIGAGVGSLVTGVPAMLLANKAQSAIGHAVAPEFTKKFEQELALGEQQNPKSAIAGDVVSMGSSAKMAGFKLAQLPFRAAVGTAVGAALPAITQQRLPTEKDLITGAATGVLFAEGRFKLLPKSMKAVGATLTEKGAASYASRQQKAGKIYATVPPQPSEGQGQVPVEEGGAGVQPQAAQEAQGALRLSPEHEALVKAESASVDVPVEIVDKPATANEPFGYGRTAGINRAKGTIELYPEFANVLNEDMKGATPEQKRLAIRSTLAEERNHLATSDADADAFVKTLSWPELAIQRRIYTGKYGGAEGVSDRDIGYESIRRYFQRLARMDTTEVARAAGVEKWKLQSLEVLNDAIGGIRKRLGTKASKEGLAILDKVQGNLDAARAVVGGQPASLRRKMSEDEARDVIARYNAKKVEASKDTAAVIRDTYARDLIGDDQERLDRIANETVEKGKNLPTNDEIAEYVQARKVLEAAGLRVEEAKTVPTGEPASLRRKTPEEQQPGFFLPPAERGVERPGATEAGAAKYQTERYLTPDKVNWERMERKGALREPAFRPITDAERADPKALAEILPRGASEGGTDLARSNTRKVTALFDKLTGRIDVVSTYKGTRGEVRMGDPSSLSADAQRPHRSFDSLLDRYTPLYSISLKEPVRNFHERFDSMQQFQEAFGNAATEEAAKRAPAPAGETLTRAKTPALGGQAGTGRAAPYQAEQFILPVEPEPVAAPQNAEAGAIHDFFRGKKPASADEMIQTMTRGGVTANRQMLSALKRMMEYEQFKDPNLSAKDALDKSVRNIYDDLTQSKDRADFTQRTLGRFAEQAPGPDRPTAAQAPAAPEGSLEAGASGPGPASLRRIKDEADARFFQAIGQVRGYFARHSVKKDISAGVDRAWNEGGPIAQQYKNSIRLPSSTARLKNGNPNDLRAARAVNAVYSPSYRPAAGGPGSAYASPSRSAIAHPDPSELPNLLKLTMSAEAKARSLLADPTEAGLAAVGLPELTGLSRGQIQTVARKWLKAATGLSEELKYAAAHFDEPALMDTTVNLRTAINDEVARERDAGRDPKQVENYLQGLYDGELYGDNSVTFAHEILGKSYGKPKKFANVYEAIEAGPYIPVFNDVSLSAAHRIKSGLQSIILDQAFHAPLEMTDPLTKQPIAIPAEFNDQSKSYQVPGGQTQYKLLSPNTGGPPIAVRKGYYKLMDDLFGKSGIESIIGGKAIMRAGAFEKHATLAGDVYHLNKMMYYALAISRLKTGFRGGKTALEYAPKDMPEAVRRGVISQKEMDWALQPHTVTLDGKTQLLTRQEILKEMQKTNLNVGRIQDAMYKHFVDKLDITIAGRKWGIGAFNRFLFDQWTRGFMAESAVNEFLRLQNAAPGIDGRTIMKRVGSDLNTQFGSSGKQGLVKNPTLRDLGQLGFLAAQWTGTRIASEVKFMSRLATTPYVAARYGRGAAAVHFGSLGRAVGTGIVTMFALTQAINLATRGKFTFQNPEEDHKLDAWVPDFMGGPGHWVSPTSVFMEMTHDVSRYMMSDRKNLGEAVTRIGENKLGPIGRAALVGVSGYTPLGQKIPTTAGRFAEAGKALIPTPITVAASGREIGHAVAPSVIAPNPPGGLQRQLYSSLGIKSETEKSADAQIMQKAKDFMDSEGLTKPTGWIQVQTTDPSYTKLRSALRNNDEAGAKKLLAQIRKTHPITRDAKGNEVDPIWRAIKNWRDHPFTGSKKAEAAFRGTLSDKDRELYFQARNERQMVLEKLADLLSQP